MLKHWAACQGNVERQNELIKRIVERVYVQDEMVVAMTLKSDYHLVVTHKMNRPTAYTVGLFLSTYAPEWVECGDDGI